MTHAEWFALIGVAIAFMGLWWRMGQAVDGKISRVYRRLDECKEGVEIHMDTHFVRQDVFKVSMDHIDRDFGRLERKLDTMDDKLDKLIENGSNKNG